MRELTVNGIAGGLKNTGWSGLDSLFRIRAWFGFYAPSKEGSLANFHSVSGSKGEVILRPVEPWKKYPVARLTGPLWWHEID